MADNLESYFKKNLSEETPAGDNWNVPSDAVWENVLPEIQKKKGLFIPWKYFYLLGGLVLTALLLLFFWPSPDGVVNTSNQNLQTEIHEPVLVPVENLNQTRQINNPDDWSDGSKATLHPTAVNNNFTGDEISETNRTVKQGTLRETNPILKDKQKAVYQNESHALLQIDNGNLAKLSMDDEKDDVQIAYLSSQSAEGIFSEDSAWLLQSKILTETPFSETASQKKKEPFDNKGKIGLGAFFAPTLTSTYINGDLNSGEMKAGNMYLYSGNWGFELKYHISNRFAILTGVEKSEIKSWSKSLVDFAYDVSGEHEMETGEKENTSAVPMPTPFGEIDTEITYRFPGEQQIPDGEMMQSVLETHQEIRYFSIPLGVEFNVIRFSRFNWFAEAGVRYNRALKDATQFSSRIIHQGDDMKVVAEEMISHPAFTENYLNFYIGTGLNYQFSKSFQMNASARYFGNITHVNLQDNMSTYVQGFSLKIGIVYLF